ncbi:hypothetical protein CDG77_35030 [Nostoc sp. 'Peltigera membranacea cyanobiont' 213]|nr:hypothetical protein CDG77_35030 [Nostoc sp. 'Peltigera membranacea cyanobiont' 213]
MGNLNPPKSINLLNLRCVIATSDTQKHEQQVREQKARELRERQAREQKARELRERQAREQKARELRERQARLHH